MRGFRGFITALDPKTVKAKAKLTAHDDMETDWLPVPQIFTTGARAFYLPRIGQQAYVFFLDDEGLQDGFILCARYSEKHQPPDGVGEKDFYLSLEDGTRIHLAPKKITIETPGDITAKASGKIEAKADGDITAKSGAAIEAEAKTSITAKAPTVTVQATISATIKAPAITLDAPAVSITGSLAVGSGISVGAAGGGEVAASGPLTITAPALTVQAPLTAGAITTPDITAANAAIGGKPYAAHVHTTSQGPTSPPV